jgi:prevent-host-death family protein
MQNMRTVQASDAKVQLLKILDEVERGQTISITRHGKPVARLTPEPDETGERARKAFESIRALRQLNSPVSVEEILSARDEGRR